MEERLTLQNTIGDRSRYCCWDGRCPVQVWACWLEPSRGSPGRVCAVVEGEDSGNTNLVLGTEIQTRVLWGWKSVNEVIHSFTYSLI